ncbi:hypothetical protein CcaCcLH18_02311 [Colletotrichum camelliae]|nr:hypothetical protein CcaCcLH18_02311 [Colletotrichum camelliae]
MFALAPLPPTPPQRFPIPEQGFPARHSITSPGNGNFPLEMSRVYRYLIPHKALSTLWKQSVITFMPDHTAMPLTR